MHALNLPSFDAKITHSEGVNLIYDSIRKKYVALTPEEWVRQHMLHFLIAHLHYPKGLTKVESGHLHNTRIKRTDIVVLNSDGKPCLLVECKAASVPLTKAVCSQLATYNAHVQAEVVAITNGIDCYTWRLDLQGRCYHSLSAIPPYAGF